MTSKDPRLRSLSGSGLPIQSIDSSRSSPPNYGLVGIKQSPSSNSAPVSPVSSSVPSTPTTSTIPTVLTAPTASVPAAAPPQSRTASSHPRSSTTGLRHPLPPNPKWNGNADAASHSSSIADLPSQQHRTLATSSPSSSPTSASAGNSSESSIDSIRRAVLQSRQPDRLSTHHRSSSSPYQDAPQSHPSSTSSAAASVLSVRPPVSPKPRLDRKESDPRPLSSSSSSSSRSTQLERREKDSNRNSSRSVASNSVLPQENSSSSIPPRGHSPEPQPMPGTRYRNPFVKSRQAAEATAQPAQQLSTAAVTSGSSPHSGHHASSLSPHPHQWPSPTHETLNPKSSLPKNAVPPPRHQHSSTSRSDPTPTLYPSRTESASPWIGSSSRHIPDTSMDGSSAGRGRSYRPGSPSREPRARDASRGRDPNRGSDTRHSTYNRNPTPPPAARASSRDRDNRPSAQDRESRRRDEQERGRSVTRGRSTVRAPSAGREWSRYDSYRPSERARSRSRARSPARTSARNPEKSPTRNPAGGHSKPSSPVRGRSKSRARNASRAQSRARSKSRPVRRTMTMGHFVPRAHTRSPSRKRRRYSSTDDSDFDDDSDSFTDHSTRRRKRASRKRRRSSEDSDSALETSEESDDTLASDAPLSKRKKASSHMDASARLQGPIADRMIELDRLTTKLTVRRNKVDLTCRKIMRTQAKLKAEILALHLSLSSSNGMIRADSPVHVHATASTSRTLAGSSSTDSDNAVVPVPAYRHAERIETGVKLSSVDNRPRNLSPAKGYRRVFEVSGPSCPVSSQSEMSALIIGGNTVFNSAFGTSRPRMMVLNPFSHGTVFDGIAAVAAMDGSVQFWDIGAQKLLNSQLPANHRVIPYPETIASRLEKIVLLLDGELKVRSVGIVSTPHASAIHAVAAARMDDKIASFVTGGKDKGLFHWKFTVGEDEDGQANYSPQGLSELHREHKGQIVSLMYSHRNKILYSGGKDGHYISCDLTTGQALVKSRYMPAKGEILHIVENPTDPNINLVVQTEDAGQYILCDHRLKNQVVQTMSYPLPDRISKLNIPSWHTDGGLICTGTKDLGGILNIWDVRWSSIARGTRPTGYREAQEPYLLNPYNKFLNSTVKRYPGLPTQSVSLGGSKLVQALFHPTRDVMITLNSDSSLAFWDCTLKQHRFAI
ncbi:hypothetical protein EMPS_04239 [Entomortierella parvispora]|uniref:Uncharacterized protein n=1 Tax=Entomortierella parvispora TaxID=205924 RepID=A0A9P3H8W0_9FUNG|nr:hypothetical protein EMPS_04239 [Entomortierella parvispora]